MNDPNQLARRLAEIERVVKQLLAPKSKARIIVDGSENAVVMKTPGGGIAARSGTTVSSATCTQWNRATSTMSTSTETYTVWNLSTVAVDPSVFIVAVETNIGWVAVWEDC